MAAIDRTVMLSEQAPQGVGDSQMTVSFRAVAILGAMEHIAKDTLGLPVEFGQAVAAAQKVYAKANK